MIDRARRWVAHRWVLDLESPSFVPPHNQVRTLILGIVASPNQRVFCEHAHTLSTTRARKKCLLSTELAIDVL